MSQNAGPLLRQASLPQRDGYAPVAKPSRYRGLLSRLWVAVPSALSSLTYSLAPPSAASLCATPTFSSRATWSGMPLGTRALEQSRQTPYVSTYSTGMGWIPPLSRCRWIASMTCVVPSQCWAHTISLSTRPGALPPRSPWTMPPRSWTSRSLPWRPRRRGVSFESTAVRGARVSRGTTIPSCPRQDCRLCLKEVVAVRSHLLRPGPSRSRLVTLRGRWSASSPGSTLLPRTFRSWPPICRPRSPRRETEAVAALGGAITCNSCQAVGACPSCAPG